MAGDWIKVEKATPDKPEVAILARRLGVSRADAFLSWFRVYCWADHVTASGIVPHLSHDDCDTLSGALPGTCQALAAPEIGWLTADADSMVFSNWDRHNGTSAKRRVYETERKRKQRAASRPVSQVCPEKGGTNNGTKAGPEKRREEKNKKKSNPPTPLLPENLDTAFFRPVLDGWLAYKAERGETYKPQGLQAMITLLSHRVDEHGPQAVAAALEKAKANQWKGWDHETSFAQSSAKPARTSPGDLWESQGV